MTAPSRWLVPFAVALAVAAGCASGGVDFTGGAEGATTTIPAPQSTTADLGPEDLRPEEEGCRPAMAVEEIEAPSDPRPAIDCDEAHGTQTVDVLRLPRGLDYADVLDATSTAELDEVIDECQAAVEEFIALEARSTDGGTIYVDSTLLSPTWYYPTEQEWDEGARWLRCDATIVPPQAAPTGTRLAAEAEFEGALAGIVDAAFRECASNAGPATDPVGDVPCTEPHQGEHLVDVVDTELAGPTGADDTQWRAAAVVAAAERCGDALTAAIGAPREDLTGHVNLPEAEDAFAQKDQLGYIAYACWVVSVSPLIGSVHGIGTEPLPGD